MLELSGLVEVRRGKAGGVFVVTDLVPAVAIFSAVKVEGAAIDVLHARRVLERAVAHEAMRTATAADMSELQRTVDLLERHLGERSSVMRADAMFHRALVRACRNETIQAAMRGVARGLAPSGTRTPAGSPTTARPWTSIAASSTRWSAATRPPSKRCSTITSGCSRSSSRRASAAAGRTCSARAPAARLIGLRRPGPGGHGARLGLEDRGLDVAEVLAVDLQRHRLVAPDDGVHDVVEDDEALPWPGAAQERHADPRDIAGTDGGRRDEVEPEVERGAV